MRPNNASSRQFIQWPHYILVDLTNILANNRHRGGMYRCWNVGRAETALVVRLARPQPSPSRAGESARKYSRIPPTSRG